MASNWVMLASSVPSTRVTEVERTKPIPLGLKGTEGGLGDRVKGVGQKVGVFFKRKDNHHTLF